MLIILLSLIKYCSTTDNEVCISRLFNKCENTRASGPALIPRGSVLTSSLRCSRWQSNEHAADEPLQKRETPATMTHICLDFFLFLFHLNHLHSERLLKCISHLYLAISVLKLISSDSYMGSWLEGGWKFPALEWEQPSRRCNSWWEWSESRTDERDGARGQRHTNSSRQVLWVLKPTVTTHLPAFLAPVTPRALDVKSPTEALGDHAFFHVLFLYYFLVITFFSCDLKIASFL